MEHLKRRLRRVLREPLDGRHLVPKHRVPISYALSLCLGVLCGSDWCTIDGSLRLFACDDGDAQRRSYAA